MRAPLRLWSLIFDLGLIFDLSSGFLFSSHDAPYCYELDLENCFRNAFVEMSRNMLDRRIRDMPHALMPLNGTMMSRKDGIQHMLLCKDMKRFSACFVYPGCTQEQASKIASTQYHMVFGKILPVQAFLSFWGYGKEVCEQACSYETLMQCKRDIRRRSESAEESLFQQAADLSSQINSEDRKETFCGQFKDTLVKLMRARSEVCGEVSKCLCMEDQLKRGIIFCNAGCEKLMHDSMESEMHQTSSITSSSLTLPFLILVIRLI
ncbi:hypothetical protein PENTCL1PPCAC_103 [Pristionchus entomophagus]|uniref:Uncharacterized protein n=1 Tax=Pristionchus entomophagus TaxID=358040 RepID=A0AAV5S6E7_9BILA|nr:hypothetical protein PENTCL1PPCAC_103 [Pristionchus entomophagus]